MVLFHRGCDDLALTIRSHISHRNPLLIMVEGEYQVHTLSNTLSKGAPTLMKAISRYYLRSFIFLLLFSLTLGACGSSTTGSNNQSSGPITVHLAYFPNLTHAVALVGVARGTFQHAIGSKVKLDTKTFNAGPSLIEALFAGDIDIGYVGPSPSINGYVKSKGAALRIIAGASSGGALLIVRPGANIQTAKDLANQKLADPQLGGTQDVSLRYYLQQNGLKTVDKG